MTNTIPQEMIKSLIAEQKATESLYMYKLNVKTNDSESVNKLISKFFNTDHTYYLTYKTGRLKNSPMSLNVSFMSSLKTTVKLIKTLNELDLAQFTLKQN